MQVKVTDIAKHKTALTVSLVSAILAFILSLIAWVGALLGYKFNFWVDSLVKVDYIAGSSTMFMVFLGPMIHFIGTYILIFIACAIYNFIAEYTGGITFNLRKEESNSTQPVTNNVQVKSLRRFV